ncbi:hypothetical protein LWP59_33845 [Amycolatopsis acidiphila]|uniref:Uncharacterized protein n=1 Tax=Amycolatopsis acidiphila TaxID=715473 RepID=A0A558A8W9_9PSEU|nr:hypothetical protein [Amycolatopsis acidiphila]TVT20704.1 hypothetical protein FNH06_19505 [Amycolatopsis acidiphila]UIJ59005.1 hypothetical protein LWP59_33845 [Amycolatopsis acidiphila]GHG73302.1 hypothetical protein GCM10017788_36540 [Amycolatopsis acidiphila]
MNEPRSAASTGNDFPYKAKTVCYIEVGKDGKVTQGGGRESYDRALAGECQLYAVWPGEWRSDLFIIDDLDEYARALGLIHDVERTGLVEHEHEVRWEISPYERNPGASYILIKVWLDCGCAIRDIRSFADHMRKQRGWDIATGGGWGGSRGDDPRAAEYSMRARRKSLTT